MNKKEKMWAWINEEFEKWQKTYPEKEVPANLRPKQKQAWIDAVMLAKEGKETVISGGGRILLWCAMRMDYPLPRVNTSWVKFIEKEEKCGRRDYILDAMKFQAREKKLGICLIKDKTLRANPDAIITDDDKREVKP